MKTVSEKEALRIKNIFDSDKESFKPLYFSMGYAWVFSDTKYELVLRKVYDAPIYQEKILYMFYWWKAREPELTTEKIFNNSSENAKEQMLFYLDIFKDI